ncbi:hypothetical protein LJC14_00515 [Treponema sp. OttesenSCG-928-L16]|nr:hypothetical protein [Treponema sp. OttesenSCG-928-L16]
MKNRRIFRENRESGFTLAEALVSVALTLLLGAAMLSALRTGMKGSRAAYEVAEQAVLALRIDTFIRDEAAGIHIPYWENPNTRSSAGRDALWRSGYGKYIERIETLTDRKGFTRGLRVTFTVAGGRYRTDALFASVPLVGGRR